MTSTPLSSLQTAPASAGTARIASIDALRGLTILVMIFVNDVGGVAGAPEWMKHFYPHDADGYTFVDVVFPAFLFIVGMSIPFAIGRRLDRGEPILPILSHILIRTLSLLLIGVFMVNSYSIVWDRAAAPLPAFIWIALAYLAVCFVFNTPPREPGRARTIIRALKPVGVIMLIALAFLYRGRDVEGAFQMRTHWWGILGLIAWAYLVACVAYIIFRRSIAAMIGVMAVLYCQYMASRMGYFSGLPFTQYVNMDSMLGSQPAITVGGVVMGMALTRIEGHAARIRWALVYGAMMFAAGHLLHQLRDLHPMFIINKNVATPPWCLITSAWTVWIWAGIYFLIDARGWTAWARPLRPAGENPLFAYILQPWLEALFGISAMLLRGLGIHDNFNIHSWLGQQGFAIGFCRAVGMAALVCWLAGWLMKRGVRLKL